MWKHMWIEYHTIAWKEAAIMDRARRGRELTLKEALHIQMQGGSTGGAGGGRLPPPPPPPTLGYNTKGCLRVHYSVTVYTG